VRIALAVALLGAGGVLSGCGGSSNKSSGATVPSLNPTRVTELLAGVTPGFSAQSNPVAITVGADGRTWFAERAGRIARVNADGTVTELDLRHSITAGRWPLQLVVGKDTRFWFGEGDNWEDPTSGVYHTTYYGGIARLELGTQVTEFPRRGHLRERPTGLTTGPDGRVWFTESPIYDYRSFAYYPDLPSRVGFVTDDGTVKETEVGVPPDRRILGAMTTTPDGRVWFLECQPGAGVGRIDSVRLDTGGSPLVGPGVRLKGCAGGMTVDNNGRIWVTEPSKDLLGVLDLSGIQNGQLRDPTEFTPSAPPEGPIAADRTGTVWYATGHCPCDYASSDEGLAAIHAGVTSVYKRAPATQGFNGWSIVAMTVGSEGKLWFVEAGTGSIGRLDPGVDAKRAK
jgi:sugar lactone lactonase YvrE